MLEMPPHAGPIDEPGTASQYELMRVLIIGFNGFLGPSIARHAFGRGGEVFGMGRSPQPSSVSDAAYVLGDRLNPDQVRQTILDRRIDVVVDVIPMVIANTQPLLDRIDGLIHQYVMISSSDVYANYALLHRLASGKATAEAVDEDSPLRSDAYPYRGDQPRSTEDPYRYLDDYDKIPIEGAVRQLSSAWTILRLPMVYGPGDKQRRFRWAIAPMLRNQDVLVIPRKWADWQSTYGYIENVGAAIAITLGRERAFNQVFNVAEQMPISQLAWARKFAEVTHWRGEIDVTDDPDHPFARRLSVLDLNVPLRINGDRLRQTFGYSDAVDEPIALAETVASEASE